MRALERRRALMLIVALCALPAARGATFDLDALMHELAAVRSAQATFVERRTVAELNRTLQSSGRLTYQAPDRFSRETLEPRRDKLEVAGNRLTMTRGGATKSFALDSTPEAQVFVEALRGTLSGNRELLDRLFELRLDGGEADWTLLMVPRDARLRGQVAEMRIGGRGDQIRRLMITLADGDRSTMEIEPVVDR